ncbi:MAG: uroporphyrinogen decarboxylase family protein [Spirochaetota bacterium]
MTQRERFQKLMNYEPVDRMPLINVEPTESGVFERWRAEGLPADIVSAADAYFGMDSFSVVPMSNGPLPPFEKKIVAEDDETYTETARLGGLVKRHKKNPTTFYGHVDYPVKTRADWEDYTLRFSKHTPGRIGTAAEIEKKCAALNASDKPVTITFFPFFTRLGFYSMGMERFLTAFYEEPDLIHDMFSYWCDLSLALARPYLDRTNVDAAIFGEDIAAKNAPLVSPDIYREFWVPHMEPLMRYLKERSVPLICQWTAGQCDPLLPIMMEQGFNCTWPLERAPGMDALAVRKKYGKGLRLAGNISIASLIAGPSAIDAEIERLMPLIREGGFFPTLDDMIALEVPLANFQYYLNAIRSIKF